jgi:predicted nucleic acid-binding protein
VWTRRRNSSPTSKVLADIVSDPPRGSGGETADPKDEFVVALVRTAEVMALVSGDPHLTELVDLDPTVLTPAAFLDGLD